MQPEPRLCIECGEPISPGRLTALPHAQECVSCVNQGAASTTVIAPPKKFTAKLIPTTTHHLKRYLVNVGQKTERSALFKTLVRVQYLFPNISPAEMTPVFIEWSKRTKSPFDQEKLRQLILEAKKWAEDHPHRAG